MLAARKKQKSVEHLAEQIRQVRSEIDAFIEERTQIFKAGPSGASLPIAWIRSELLKHGCPCEAALHLIESDQ